MKRAGRGDKEAEERLRRLIRETPEIWQQVGDLTSHVETSLISMIAKGSVVLEESLRTQIREMRQRLSEDDGHSPIIGLLVDQVVTSWLESRFAQMAANQPQQYQKDVRFWEQKRERATKRHLESIRELAEVQSLLRPD